MSYTPPVKYSAVELRQMEIDDLRVDYKCAIRDNLPEYAAKVAKKLATMGVFVCPHVWAENQVCPSCMAGN